MKIRYAGSLDGQIDLLSLPTNVDKISKMMEEMANAPKEEFGKRTAGERGMYERSSIYEIQRLESRKGRSNSELHELPLSDN